MNPEETTTDPERPAPYEPAGREGGFTTAEMLANAALAIAALLVIWLALTDLGTDVVGWIRQQILR